MGDGQSPDRSGTTGTTGTAGADTTEDRTLTPDAMDAFVVALQAARAALNEVPGKLEGARVHDFAFGKMFEATEVRDAYHHRLPETEKDIAEACEVIEHFISGLRGGHSIGARPGAPEPPPSGPGRAPDTFPWRRTIPQQLPGGSAS
jgi:hypothetical protein